jgi:general stress protein YciG
MAKDKKNTNRGLASANPETRVRVAREGGKAPHDERGLQATDNETRIRVAREGGKASHGGRNTSKRRI